MSEACFQHEAFFYADREEFLAGTTAFIQEGLEAEEAILVALPRRSRAHLTAALSGEKSGVRFVEMEEIQVVDGLVRNASFTDYLIPTILDMPPVELDVLELGDPDSPYGLRGIGEPIWSERGADELDECRRHELLLNVAFEEGRPWHLMCPYDATRLDADVLRSAEQNHPILSGSRPRSAGYAGTDRPDTRFEGELEVPSTVDAEFSFTVERLADLRRLVGAEAERAGGKAPGPVGRLLSKSFGKSRRAADKSHSTGQRARAKLPL